MNASQTISFAKLPHRLGLPRQPRWALAVSLGLGLLFVCAVSRAQTGAAEPSPTPPQALASSSSDGADLLSSSLLASVAADPGLPGPSSGPAPLRGSGAASGGALPTRKIGLFSRVGVAGHIGIDGIGFDVASPLSERFNLRTGADFFSYTDTFVDQGANVSASLQLRTGHVALDWFPFHGRLRVSPLFVFANNNHVRASAIIPGGSTVTLSGSDYVSSTTDPLHGTGSVDFRKAAPGLSVGIGNLIPRSGRHFSFPVEVGFYYVGQPTLKVAFTGSACNPTEPTAIGCQSVGTDADFQKSLAAFTARNNNNLSYASFFPIASAGVGYSF